MRIPSVLIPRCPKCGKTMTMNLRSDNCFVEDEGWKKAASRYEVFLRRHKNLHILFLEIGVGYNTPGIIKYPFWQMTAQNSNATYVCLNNKESSCPREIEQQSICINRDVRFPAGTVITMAFVPFSCECARAETGRQSVSEITGQLAERNDCRERNFSSSSNKIHKSPLFSCLHEFTFPSV